MYDVCAFFPVLIIICLVLRPKRDVPLYKESILNVEMKIVNSNFISLFLHTQLGCWRSADERWRSNLHPPIAQRYPSIVARDRCVSDRSLDGACVIGRWRRSVDRV